MYHFNVIEVGVTNRITSVVLSQFPDPGPQGVIFVVLNTLLITLISVILESVYKHSR